MLNLTSEHKPGTLAEYHFVGKKWKSHLLLVWSLTAFWKDQIMFTIEEDSCEIDKERKEIKKTALYHIWSVTLCHGIGPHTVVLKGCSNYLMRKTLPLSLASVSETSRCKPESPQVARVSRKMATGRHYGNEGNLGQSPQITESRNRNQMLLFLCHCWVQPSIWKAWILTSQKRKRRNMIPSE